jgi:hypothetical protein
MTGARRNRVAVALLAVGCLALLMAAAANAAWLLGVVIVCGLFAASLVGSGSND